MPTINKPWGVCTPIARGSIVQLDKLRILKGGFSSLHWHDRRVNQFVIESGDLTIYHADRRQLHAVTLGPGHMLSIDPGVIHQFYCEADCVCWEFYYQKPQYGQIDPDDIVRLTQNGRDHFPVPTLESVQHALQRYKGRQRNEQIEAGK